MARDEHWVTVQEAARRLGVKDDAIRKRIQRGALRSEKELDDGRVYVYMDTTQDAAHDGAYAASQDRAHAATEDTTYAASEDAGNGLLVEELRGHVSYLEKMLDQEREARTEERRRHDTLMAALLQRIPELEAPGDERNGHVSYTDDSGNGAAGGDDPQEPTQRRERSWWRRFFGFE